MPATAGRVRMPANNRLSVSDSLRTSEIWQKSVGYDPYAPDRAGGASKESEDSEVNDKARGLFALARLTGNSSSVTPGACRKCGQVGHLPYQCRNYMTALSGKVPVARIAEESDSDEEEDEEEEKEKEEAELLIQLNNEKKGPTQRPRTPSTSSDGTDTEEDRRRRKRKSKDDKQSRKSCKERKHHGRSGKRESRSRSRHRSPSSDSSSSDESHRRAQRSKTRLKNRKT